MISNQYNYNRLAAYNVQSTYSTTTVKGTYSYLDITGNATSSKYGDSMDVSSTAQSLLQRSKDLDVFSCIYPNNDVSKKAKSLSSVTNDFQSDFNSFASAFGSLSSSLGLSGDESFTMGLNGTGGMNISGSSASETSALSSAFTNKDGSTSTMTARFALMAARGALADAGYSEPGFQEAYAQDPYAAINDNIDALKERLLGFRVVAQGGQMSYGFVREGELELSETTAEITVGSEQAAAV